MEFSVGLMAIDMKESSNTIILKGMVDISGLMDDNTKDFGKIIKCMEKVLLYGQMAENISENT